MHKRVRLQRNTTVTLPLETVPFTIAYSDFLLWLAVPTLGVVL
ncbi:hypothetical protein [Scytonema sp. NUACC21]